ncbi:chemotaxis protein CheW [Undibacterium sp. TJN25]|uniref:chemotaxis protein CheW n=1 Tax=Undibacterium sp. TJN25 TaxID=3413056 RepID=UPI003BF179A4
MDKTSTLNIGTSIGAVADELSESSLQLLQELRSNFDSAFSREPPPGNGRPENFLALKVAGDAYALRVSQISGLYAGRTITMLPSPLPELIGISGFRAQVTPVYDLASLLGYPRASATRWIAVLRHDAPVAVAFEEFDAHLSVTPSQITASDFSSARGRDGSSRLRNAIQAEGAILPIIDLQSLIKDIQQRVDATRTIKER